MYTFFKDIDLGKRVFSRKKVSVNLKLFIRFLKQKMIRTEWNIDLHFISLYLNITAYNFSHMNMDFVVQIEG